jgi:mono/diheme cytochrome c family protein
MGELTTALAAEGPASAIGVCREVAQVVAQDVSAREGLEVGRTSLRLRNPANAPDDWERAQLEAFVAAAASGADPTTLEHAEVVTENGAQVFRWMKAIPMGELCVQCHGPDVAPEVAAAIRAAYPEDQATGFRPGEIRGAFTVRKPL